MDSYNCHDTIKINGNSYDFINLKKLTDFKNAATLPFALKILLENLLRNEDGQNVTKEDINQLLNWDPKAEPSVEINFSPSRVLLQDFTGVPAVVDLGAMRDAMVHLGGDPEKINPLSPVELVIDHSVMVDHYGTPEALSKNTKIEFERNYERYCFLHWGQQAFDNFKVVPPDTGIVHQVNLEYLARVIFNNSANSTNLLYPDTVVGTDSHTTMINGLGVLGWGVGGIEAEAVMLGQPITMLIPQVIGFELTGNLKEGTTATDLVLTVVEMLRKKGVVGKFVEFFGSGISSLSLADRATIANMSPEFGATCGIFPIDDETIKYLRLSSRDESHIAIIEQYTKAQGMYLDETTPKARYSDTLTLDLASVEPSLAGPTRPQDRIALRQAKQSFNQTIQAQLAHRDLTKGKTLELNETIDIEIKGHKPSITHGAVVIAAITSCTNTSNPSVMIGAGLVAKKAIEKGLTAKPWVKTSLAPGSQVVEDYLKKANLLNDLENLGFNLVGFGCTTCIGNSGPLPVPVSDAIDDNNMSVCAVLSGNRNFSGRVHRQVQNCYLASPPLVVAYALAGTLDIDLYNDPLGQDQDGKDVFLKDIWPSEKEISDTMSKAVTPDMFSSRYSEVFKGDEQWQAINTPKTTTYNWGDDSTYIKHPPFFENMSKQPEPISDIVNAKTLVMVGDSITTDHISPAGQIAANSPAGKYLVEKGISPKDFNSYGSRRGNHEVMMRGTFANIRLKNLLAPGTEGGWTQFLPSNEQMSIYDAAMLYKKQNTELIILAGKEYGTGSSRDWAAKGTALLGVKAVIAQSYERIHRSNLIGMGVLPLQFTNSENAEILKLTGRETFSISTKGLTAKAKLTVQAVDSDGNKKEFSVLVRIDTPKELDYYQHGGILHYVLRQLAA